MGEGELGSFRIFGSWVVANWVRFVLFGSGGTLGIRELGSFSIPWARHAVAVREICGFGPWRGLGSFRVFWSWAGRGVANWVRFAE